MEPNACQPPAYADANAPVAPFGAGVEDPGNGFWGPECRPLTVRSRNEDLITIGFDQAPRDSVDSLPDEERGIFAKSKIAILGL